MFDEFLNCFRLNPGIGEISLRLLCAMPVGVVIGTTTPALTGVRRGCEHANL